MGRLDNLKIGVALCGSFCTFSRVLTQIQNIIDEGADVTAIMSYNSSSMDTRFGTAEYFKSELKKMTNKDIIMTIEKAEEVGPKKLFDVLVVMPCTGNSLGKLANAIVDTPVIMACKSHLRNQTPLVLAVSTNDGLSMSLKNIGLLMNTKNIYFIPFEQDNCIAKPNSLVAKMELVIPTILSALEGNQIQPVLAK